MTISLSCFTSIWVFYNASGVKVHLLKYYPCIILRYFILHLYSLTSRLLSKCSCVALHCELVDLLFSKNVKLMPIPLYFYSVFISLYMLFLAPPLLSCSYPERGGGWKSCPEKHHLISCCPCIKVSVVGVLGSECTWVAMSAYNKQFVSLKK